MAATVRGRGIANERRRKPLGNAEKRRCMAQQQAAGRVDRSEGSVQELLSLVEKATQAVGEVGPRRVVKRTMDALRAISGIADEALLSSPRPSLSPAVLRAFCERMGATYIKLGQFVASSPTLFPADVVDEFQKLLDSTEPTPFPIVRSIIAHELQQPPWEAFDWIDPEPLASASVAQVHSARLKRSQKEVVVKVLKPETEDALTADLTFLETAVSALQFARPELSRLSLADVVSDLRQSILEESDFRNEARNINEFRQFLDASGAWDAAYAPFVYEQLSTSRLLTLERLKGVSLTDVNAVRAIGDPEQMLVSSLEVWLASLGVCPSFHADLHAGNLLALPDGRVGFLDFGIVGRIRPETFAAARAFMASVETGDFDTMARSLITLGAVEGQGEAPVDPSQLARDLERVFEKLNSIDRGFTVASDAEGNVALSGALTADEAQLDALVVDIAQVARQYGLRFPREFALLLKQVLYLDRFLRLLAPEVSLLSLQTRSDGE